MRWIVRSLFFGLAVMGFSYFYSKKVLDLDQDDKFQEAQRAELTELPTAKEAQKISPKKSRTETPPPAPKKKKMSQATAYRKAPPKENWAEFEVKNGLAIMQGDLLLGEVESGFKGQSGYYESEGIKLWPSREIEFLIHQDLEDQKDVILEAVEHINERTVIDLYPGEAGAQEALMFTRGEEHCYSYLGRKVGVQPIFLSESCGFTEIVHEVGHALGLIHEHSRLDRDQYLKVLWDNISQKFWRQFHVVPRDWMEATAGTDFDYRSIMLYGKSFFAKDPQSMVSLESRGDQPIRPSRELSAGDVEKINTLYRSR